MTVEVGHQHVHRIAVCFLAAGLYKLCASDVRCWDGRAADRAQPTLAPRATALVCVLPLHVLAE